MVHGTRCRQGAEQQREFRNLSGSSMLYQEHEELKFRQTAMVIANSSLWLQVCTWQVYERLQNKDEDRQGSS